MANHLQKQQQHKPAFVLGNGISRRDFDTSILTNYGATYGCNALYRDCPPDHLIAVDAKMIREIIQAGYHVDHNVWTNPNNSVQGIEHINYLEPHLGWSSGPTALWLAIQHGFKEIYILGFDFEGINGKFNNVYADSFNYKKSADAATYYGNWMNQTATLIRQNPQVKFHRVVQPTCNTAFKELPQGSDNFRHLSYQEFRTKYSYSQKMSE
jgi:hypothetical protein